jgi:hypothetical protein
MTGTEEHLLMRKSSFDSQLAVFYVRFEVFTAVAIKNAVFWDVTP